VGEVRTVVVGAGIGGLTSAVTLAAQGCDVLVCEKAAAVGGKMRTLMPPAATAGIDAGPTVFTMRWVFDDILSRAGLALEDIVSLRPARVLARHAWSEDEKFDLFADEARTADAIAAFAGPADARGYRAFCTAARSTYLSLRDTFIAAEKPSMPGLVGRLGVQGLAKFSRASPFATLAGALRRHFQDPRLRQLFGRYATYVGSSPYACPATLMLIAHVEQEGVWLVDGGMHALARGLAGAAEQLGARIQTGTEVVEIVNRNGRVTGVRLADGTFVEADAVVFNGEANALAAGMLGPGARNAVAACAPAARSLSAVTFAVVAQTEGFPLVRHTVFFSRDYADEFAALFGRACMPEDPTVYVCAQDRSDEDDPAQTGPERLLCLMNAPANGDAATSDQAWSQPEEIERCRNLMTRRLAACGLTLRVLPQGEAVSTPRDFATLFPGSGGALYGRASHGWQASFQRPTAHTRLTGLYLAGGSVHPGAGVPMAALSGWMAGRRLLSDLASTRTSYRVAMPGGISTG